jgi:hypothetical protein
VRALDRRSGALTDDSPGTRPGGAGW